MTAARDDRILVVRLGAIGDALRVLPAVRRLRLERPGALIGWAVEDWALPVLAGNPNVDRFHVLGRGAVRSGGWRALKEIARFAREIRAGGYDVALDFHGRLKSGFVSRASGARERIGYARGQCTEGNHLFTNVHVRLDDPLENRVLRFLDLLRPLGIEARFEPGETGLWVSADDRRRAVEWYRASGSPSLAVYPGTSRNQAAYHRWPAEKWVALLDRLAAEGVASVVFWGPDDEEWTRGIAERVGVGCLLAPKTTLAGLMASLAGFRAFIGANTAAMHMAWMQGVPTAFFPGPADPRTDGPLPPVPSRALRAAERVRAGVSKRRQPDVVQAVGVEEAHDAVRQLLDPAAETTRNPFAGS